MLTIYAPSNKPESKCWEVFNGIKKTWTTETKTLDNTATETFNSPLDEYMFWGFTGNNLNLVHQLEDRKLNYWFTDTPYFGRFDNKNLKPDNHYWRIAKNNIHVGMINDCPEDRLQKFNIKVKDRNKKGKLRIKASKDIAQLIPNKNLQFHVVDATIKQNFESRFLKTVNVQRDHAIKGKELNCKVPKDFDILHNYKLKIGIK